MGISQQKNTMMKQRLTSSVSIFFTSPYLTTRISPRAAIPTTTIDQPMISHLKKSDKLKTSIAYSQTGNWLVIPTYSSLARRLYFLISA